MSALPIALDATRVSALVVGGGAVGTRKAQALAAAGARVRVVAPAMSDELGSLAAGSARVTLVRRGYDSSLLAEETLVIAATSSREVNARVGADARARGKLVSLADAPDQSDFHMMAVHRAGEVTLGVVTGGVPAAAARIRDSLSATLDNGYADAVRALHGARTELLATQPEKWAALQSAIVGEEFCPDVEAGRFTDKLARWI